MPETRINANDNHIFPQGTLVNQLELDNRHNVQGPVTYRIAAQPVVNIPMQPNQEYFAQNINGQQVQVWNNLPNSLYCVY